MSGSVVTSRCFPNTSIYEKSLTWAAKDCLEKWCASRRTWQIFKFTKTRLAFGLATPVIFTGELLSVTLGPGLLGQVVLDGIGRPLGKLGEISPYISKGIHIDTIGDEIWTFKPRRLKGDYVGPGDILGEVKEKGLTHMIMVPLSANAESQQEITWIAPSGEYSSGDTICEINGRAVKMHQKWNVRIPRKASKKLDLNRPLITGTRVLDVFFRLPWEALP